MTTEHDLPLWVHTMALCRVTFGSHLYGTATPQSDRDEKGVYEPYIEDLILGKAQGILSFKRAKEAGEKNTADDFDLEFISLQKFIKLACEGQMVAIDMLHAKPEMILSTSTTWEMLRSLRSSFYSKGMGAFVGYAMRQAAKYGVKGSRLACAKAWLGLLQEHTGKRMSEVVQIAVEQWPDGHPAWEHATVYPQPDNTTVCLLAVGKQFTSNAKAAHYASSMQLFVDEYGARARAAEESEGVDWKAMSHAIRASEQAIAILSGSPLLLPFEPALAQHLVDIKLGRLKFRPVLEELETNMDKVKALSAVSNLPERIDPAKFDSLILNCYGY